jgi:hypothetical protein
MLDSCVNKLMVQTRGFLASGQPWKEDSPLQIARIRPQSSKIVANTFFPGCNTPVR